MHIQEEVTQGDPLLMFLNGITLFLLSEELRAIDPALMVPFYLDNTSFYGLVQNIVHLLTLLLEQGSDMEYFPDPSKFLFV